MPKDKAGGGSEPTLTPSEAIAVADTSASLVPAPRVATTGPLSGRYRLGSRLGAGGMGEVLVASDHQIEREVAIKRMRIAPTPDAVARFVREAKIQGRLDHPAIVPVHELATDAEGRPFFAMKRLSGTTLAALLAGGSVPPRQKLLRAFADICLAIEFAHSRKVIHRDLKPDNVMLGGFGEVYVLDWGIARSIDEADPASAPGLPERDGMTEVGAILGTPGYIAPELLRGEAVDERADVYALGCILFEILAGESFLPRGKAGLDAALSPPDNRPSRRAPAADIPPELDAACVAATTLDRAARPTARGLAEQVEHYLDGDRDLVARRTLATQHAAAARAALARGDGEVERAAAMREAGRAIALDPHNQDAIGVVAALMLEPPREVPREVDDKVAALDEVAFRVKARMMTWTMLLFGAFVPFLWIMGVRSKLALVAFVVILAANIGILRKVARQPRASTVPDRMIAGVGFAALVATIAYTFTPFLLAPPVAAVGLIMFVVDPRTRWVPTALTFLAAILAPWALGLAGVLPEQTTSVAGDLVLRSDTLAFTMPAIEVGLVAFATVLVAVAGYMVGQIAQTQRASARKLELQAWHLRQLVS